MVKKKQKNNVVSINWEEEEGTKFIKNPGEYIVITTEAVVDEDDEGKQFISWTFQVTKGKASGATISTRTYITPKALWKLRELLQSIKVEVESNSVQDIDLDQILEDQNEFVIEVEEGNERADGNGYYMTVADFMSLEDYQETTPSNTKEDEVEEEAPAAKPNKKQTKKSEPEEEAPKSKKSKKKAEPEIDEEELLDQMEEEIDELGLDIDLDDYDTFEEKQEAFEKAKKKASKGNKSSTKKEEEDEEQTYTVEEIEALGTKQLKVIAEEIGLELDEEASTRSKRRSVIAGLRKAGLLEEE